MTGAELTRRRVALKLSQRSLARIAGVHYQTVFKWEHNQRRVPKWIELVLDTLDKNPENMVSTLSWLLKNRMMHE